MEPADAWLFSVRYGWLPHATVASPTVLSRNGLAHPAASAAARDSLAAGAKAPPPLSDLAAGSAAPSEIGSAQRAQMPPHIEATWEVFEFLGGSEFAASVSLPELHFAQRLARSLLRHSFSGHGEGLKVSYVISGEAQLGACPTHAANPARPITHATLAKSLSKHPSLEHDQALRKALIASLFPSPPSRAAKNFLQQTPEQPRPETRMVAGGTRLVGPENSQTHQEAPYLILAASVQFGHTCEAGPLFEQVASFHANVLYLTGCVAPLQPETEAMKTLVQRIEVLRATAAKVSLVQRIQGLRRARPAPQGAVA